jgi:Flp pilus assembly protein TadG
MAPRGIFHFFRGTRATAATEFALIAPILLILIAGVVEFGNIFQVYNSVNRLASQYAIAWADCADSSGSCSSAGELANYTPANAIANIFPQLQNFSGKGQLRMFQVSMAAAVPVITTPSILPPGVYEYPTVAVLSATEIAASQTFLCPQPVSASTCTGQSGVIVTASYTYTPLYFPTLMTSILNGHFTPTYTVAQLMS